MFTREQIENAIKLKNYVWFNSDLDYDVNIVGVRNNSSNTVTNLFDDWITVSYKKDKKWQFHCWNATTDPGKTGMINFRNSTGIAILVPGQYRGSHAIGLHQGKYEALRQINNVKVYRDSNRNMVYDKNKIQEGVFGINLHKAGQKSKYVDNWSEGCQVFSKTSDFDAFMKICRQARKIHGNSFTYTLLELSDVQ